MDHRTGAVTCKEYGFPWGEGQHTAKFQQRTVLEDNSTDEGGSYIRWAFLYKSPFLTLNTVSPITLPYLKIIIYSLLQTLKYSGFCFNKKISSIIY